MSDYSSKRKALKSKLIIGITMGDPAGIGPEIIIKALMDKSLYSICTPVVIGNIEVMRKAISLVKGEDRAELSLKSFTGIGELGEEERAINILSLNNVDASSLIYGKISAECGQAAVDYIKKAVTLALSDEIQAVVTCPIHKEAINRAGYKYPGHTELIANLTKTRKYAMMLVGGGLRIVHVSLHLPLSRVKDQIKKERILMVIKLGNELLAKIGIKCPRIAVAGFNPHAGEGGLFGEEEKKEIIPAIVSAKEKGIDVAGPIAPDVIFSEVRGGKYDLAVAMYHDQGHIAVKTAEFIYNRRSYSQIGGVNVTLGLPIVRTSVAHGVAFDQAGKGSANPESLKQAIRLAAKLAM